MIHLQYIAPDRQTQVHSLLSYQIYHRGDYLDLLQTLFIFLHTLQHLYHLLISSQSQRCAVENTPDGQTMRGTTERLESDENIFETYRIVTDSVQRGVAVCFYHTLFRQDSLHMSPAHGVNWVRLLSSPCSASPCLQSSTRNSSHFSYYSKFSC